MKKIHWIITIFFALALLTIVVLAVIASNKQKENPVLNNNDTVIFYYSLTCPHCKITEQYMTDNDIDSKIRIVRKEVSKSQANSIELQQAAKKCNISPDETGVPFMAYKGSCYMGDVDTINLLKQLTGEN